MITVDALCQQQFEESANPSMQDAFVHASDADDYYFGFFAQGTGILHVANNGDQPLTVLDVGVGDGTYLAEAKEQYGDGLRAIGITAIKHFPERPDVEYVYGDIQRSATWQPQGMLTPDSVDIAVSSLTLQHLIDPLAALRNISSVLKPDGHLFTSPVVLPLHPSNTQEAAIAIRDRLKSSAGLYDLMCVFKSLPESSSSLTGGASIRCLEFSGHLKNAAGLFDGIETHVIEDPNPIVAYSLAAEV